MSDALSKLQDDLTKASELVRTWRTDPAQVAVNYGLAKSKDEVRVQIEDGASDSLTESPGGSTQAHVCGHLCTPVAEGGLEGDW